MDQQQKIKEPIKERRVSLDDLNLAVQQMIEGKTDREVAILGGALIEGIVFDLLSRVLVDSQFQRLKSLFEYPKPLSSFGNMLSLAYAFSAISADEFHMANVIRKVRNHAAHSIGLREHDEFCFTKEPVRGMLFEFYPKFAMGSAPKELKEEVIRTFDQLLKLDRTSAYRLVFCNAHTRLMARSMIAPATVSPREINEDGVVDVVWNFDAEALEAGLGKDLFDAIKSQDNAEPTA
jgi:hypothetical protein